VRPWRRGAALAGVVAFGSLAAAAAPLEFSFDLPQAATTSAAAYDARGHLLRTLWRGEVLVAGAHHGHWDGLDDQGRPADQRTVEIRLIQHQVRYVWEGVVGNSSDSFDPAQVHKAYLPPSSIVVAGPRAYYAVGYNEAQGGIHGFDLDRPQRDLRPPYPADAFAAISMLAADATDLYWANTGGLSKTSFVGVFDTALGRVREFAAGTSVCLQRRPGGDCYGDQFHPGVIDVGWEASARPTGIAVQAQGRMLAVAHGGQGRIALFDKRSGQPLGQLELPLAPEALNQIAFAPGGDLWVVSGAAVLRYTGLGSAPRLVRRIDGLTRPLALAAVPGDDGSVWVAEGGAKQQVERFDGDGQVTAVIGAPGGALRDPAVRSDRLCFVLQPGIEQTALAAGGDGSLWVVDTCNNRMLRYRDGGRSDTEIAYLPHVYASTVDHGNPRRVFANYLEFDVDNDSPLTPGRSWRLVRNWLGGLPRQLQGKDACNVGFGGFRTVETLGNGRTYGLVASGGRDYIVELPAAGGLRVVRALAAAGPGRTPMVMYENGDLGQAVLGSGRQQVVRLALQGFDAASDPVWDPAPRVIASVPTQEGTPFDRGAFSGIQGPRFPVTASGMVAFLDPSVKGNEGFHLGATRLGDDHWLWLASPSGRLDGRGSFQTQAIDHSVNYGGNTLWGLGRQLIFGYHGEFFTDLGNGRVGQANQFMHFLDDGLFVGQFGAPSTRPPAPGMSGNAFSPTLVRAGDRLFLYHNDESTQGGIHRWRIDGWQQIRELSGTSLDGVPIVLR
jgi:hypothetical protein